MLSDTHNDETHTHTHTHTLNICDPLHGPCVVFGEVLYHHCAVPILLAPCSNQNYKKYNVITTTLAIYTYAHDAVLLLRPHLFGFQRALQYERPTAC